MIGFSSMLSSCKEDFYSGNSDLNYRVKILLPDSFLYYPELNTIEVIELLKGNNLNLFLHTELYEEKGIKTIRIEKCCSELADNSEILNSYSLKSNTTYQLLYYLEIRDESRLLYDPEDLKSLTLNSEKNTIATGPNKECFVGKVELKGRFEEYCDTISLKSPFSFFELYATDIKNYLENNTDISDSLEILLEYRGFYPMSFDISLDRPSFSMQGIKISDRIKIKDIKSKPAKIISDFVFMSDPKSTIDIRVTISDTESKSSFISVTDLKFELIHGKRSRIFAPFFTGNKDGIGIDTSFNDDIIIPI